MKKLLVRSLFPMFMLAVGARVGAGISYEEGQHDAANCVGYATSILQKDLRQARMDNLQMAIERPEVEPKAGLMTVSFDDEMQAMKDHAKRVAQDYIRREDESWNKWALNAKDCASAPAQGSPISKFLGL